MAAPVGWLCRFFKCQSVQRLGWDLVHKTPLGLKTPGIINFACVQQRRLCSSSLVEADQTEDTDSLYKTVEIEVKCHDTAVLKSYEQFVKLAAQELEVCVAKCWTPPRVIKRYSLLKSVHVYKKHWVQYEMRTHFRVLQVQHLTGSTLTTFLEYIQRNLPEGIAMKVTKHRLEEMPSHLKPPPKQETDSAAIS